MDIFPWIGSKLHINTDFVFSAVYMTGLENILRNKKEAKDGDS
jgi:hypothetical protein